MWLRPCRSASPGALPRGRPRRPRTRPSRPPSPAPPPRRRDRRRPRPWRTAPPPWWGTPAGCRLRPVGGRRRSRGRTPFPGGFAFPVPVVGEHAEVDVAGVGERGLLGELEPLVELPLHALLDGLHAVLVDGSRHYEQLCELLHRVAVLHVLGEHLLRHVLRRVVPGVALPPQRHGLDERGSVAVPGPLHGLGGGHVHVHDLV